MKVLFLYPNKRIESLVPPVVCLLSRILKDAGHEVRLFDTTNYDINLDGTDQDRSVVDPSQVKKNRLTVIPTEAIHRESHGDVVRGFIDEVSNFGPDLIAVTSTESTFLLAVALIKELRKLESVPIPTVLGGVFATKAPRLALRYPEIDMCVVGEGESVLLTLCNAIKEGRDLRGLAGLHVKDGDAVVQGPPAEVVDINQNPVDLDVGLFEESRLYRPMCGKIWRMLSVETHRGCPYTCTFCNSPGQNGIFGMEFFRKKDPAKVREEILYYRDHFGINFVFFWADTFLAWSRDEFDAFCEMYSDIKLPFWCQTRTETVTEYYMKRLMDIGLFHMSFGLEHGNEGFRRVRVGRDYTNKDFVRKMGIVADCGQTFTVNNIVGFPDETRELVFDTIELNRSIPPPLSGSCSICMPYHGTEVHRYALSSGYIEEDTICPSNNDNAIMNMSSMSGEEIVGLANTFTFYRTFPKSRWPEIRLAEAQTDEGRAVFTRLRDEFQQEFMPKISVIASE